jgi:hypothetical protein
MDMNIRGDVAQPAFSLQTLNVLSGDELYRYYRCVFFGQIGVLMNSCPMPTRQHAVHIEMFVPKSTSFSCIMTGPL